MEDAKKCEESGAFAIVLECVPHQLATEISQHLSIPVIGIGAGNGCDGQVLVFHDLIGYGVDRLPKFVKSYGNIQTDIVKGIKNYISDVKSGKFPTDDTSYTMNEEVLIGLYGGGRS